MIAQLKFEKIDKPPYGIAEVMSQKGSYCADSIFRGTSEIKLIEWISNDFSNGLVCHLNDGTIDLINEFLISVMIRDKEDKDIRYHYYLVDSIGFASEKIQKDLLSDLVQIIASETTKYLKENNWIDSEVDFYFTIYQE